MADGYPTDLVALTLISNSIADYDDLCDSDDSEMRLCKTIIWIMAFFFLNEDEYQTPRPRPPKVPRVRYRFTNSIQDPCALFRFSEMELRYIARLMGEPGFHHTSCRDKFTLVEGLCILTRRLCYPCRFSDLVQLFGRSISALDRIYLYMLDKIIKNTDDDVMVKGGAPSFKKR